MAWDRCDEYMPGETSPCPCCHAAANEIERLRVALKRLLLNYGAALPEGKKDQRSIAEARGLLGLDEKKAPYEQSELPTAEDVKGILRDDWKPRIFWIKPRRQRRFEMNFDSPQWSDLFGALFVTAVVALVAIGVFGGIVFLASAR